MSRNAARLRHGPEHHRPFAHHAAAHRVRTDRNRASPSECVRLVSRRVRSLKPTTARLLLGRGADQHVANNRGETPMTIAEYLQPDQQQIFISFLRSKSPIERPLVAVHRNAIASPSSSIATQSTAERQRGNIASIARTSLTAVPSDHTTTASVSMNHGGVRQLSRNTFDLLLLTSLISHILISILVLFFSSSMPVCLPTHSYVLPVCLDTVRLDSAEFHRYPTTAPGMHACVNEQTRVCVCVTVFRVFEPNTN